MDLEAWLEMNAQALVDQTAGNVRASGSISIPDDATFTKQEAFFALGQELERLCPGSGLRLEVSAHKRLNFKK